MLLLSSWATCANHGLVRGSGDVNIQDDILGRWDRVTVGQAEVKSAGILKELYTDGLASCIGMAAVGTPDNNIGIDKVLAHVSSLDKRDGSTFTEQFARWEQAIKDSGMTDLKIYLSVPQPDVQPACCEAMSDMIAEAKQTCIDLGVGCATLERRNEDVGESPPFGTVLISVGHWVYMEGQKVS